MDGRVLQTAKVCGVIPKSRGQLQKTWQVHIVSPWTSKTQIMKGKKKEKKKERNKEGKVKQNQWRNNIPYICQKKNIPYKLKNAKTTTNIYVNWEFNEAVKQQRKCTRKPKIPIKIHSQPYQLVHTIYYTNIDNYLSRRKQCRCDAYQSKPYKVNQIHHK